MKKKLFSISFGILFSITLLAGCNKTVEPSKVLDFITVSSEAKISYRYDEEFVKPTVIATYNDKSTKEVTSQTIFSGFDSTTPGAQTITASYTEKSIEKTDTYTVTIADPQTKLKFAIFSDIQLCYEKNTTDAASNLGATANAPVALKNHFQFIKNQGIDVVLMNGDVTNQANEIYYNYFYKILKEVYGSEDKYPEFIWNMGNHEWWWGTTEKESGDAVSLFKQYARIESSNLVKTSKVAYSINPNQTVPTYYKVIKGVPFLVISAENSSGYISSALKLELQGWLEEIKALPSVKKGGPIYVQYHYALSSSMTHGQGKPTKENTYDVVENLLKDIPNAVVFTGDTHFPGTNERAINQVNFTTINLGSSSYSRMVEQSAVICNDYYNVESGSTAKAGDRLTGNAKYKEAYTPTIQLVEVSEDNSYTIDRYFSDFDGKGKLVGKQWKIDPISSKEDFTYTNERFQNKEAANDLYGKNGLNWDNSDTVTFGVDEETNQMTVKFKDVIDHHFVEHYQIKVNGTKTYDVVSTYYLYNKERENNYYILENVPVATDYSVEVTAYDFFDNPSTNKLISSNNDETECIDAIDNQMTKTYTDIQTRNRFDEVAEGSQSSLEYYYQGIQPYNAGATLGRLFYKDGVGCNDYLSINDDPDATPIITATVKNIGQTDVKVGITAVIKNQDGTDKWLADFDSNIQKVVSNDGEWVTLTWNLKTLYGVTSKGVFSNIALKARPVEALSKGVFEMDILVDNIDITGSAPVPERETQAFEAEKDFQTNVPHTSTTDGVLTIDFKFEEATSEENNYINIALMEESKKWDRYLGYYRVSPSGIKGVEGVSSFITEDGFTRVVFDFAKMDVGDITQVEWLYIRGKYSYLDGVLEVNPTQGKVIRGTPFTAGNDATWEDKKNPFQLSETITIDVKITSDSSTHISLMLGDGWHNYFGYFSITSATKTDDYVGLTVTLLSDGYSRLEFDMTEVGTGKDSGKVNGNPQEVSLIYIRGDWTNANGYFDVILDK